MLGGGGLVSLLLHRMSSAFMPHPPPPPAVQATVQHGESTAVEVRSRCRPLVWDLSSGVLTLPLRHFSQPPLPSRFK